MNITVNDLKCFINILELEKKEAQKILYKDCLNYYLENGIPKKSIFGTYKYKKVSKESTELFIEKNIKFENKYESIIDFIRSLINFKLQETK